KPKAYSLLPLKLPPLFYTLPITIAVFPAVSQIGGLYVVHYKGKSVQLAFFLQFYREVQDLLFGNPSAGNIDDMICILTDQKGIGDHEQGSSIHDYIIIGVGKLLH